MANRYDRFGWVNASYVFGLTIINEHMTRALGTLTPWETFARMTGKDKAVLKEDLEED